jgi:hypothetical protein
MIINSVPNCACSRLLACLLAANIGIDDTSLAANPPQILDVKFRWRRIPLSHSRHHIGRAIFRPNHPAIDVESHLERRVVKALSHCGECTSLASQPVTVWFLFNNKVHRYTPDLMATFSRSSRVPWPAGEQRAALIEVKPTQRLDHSSRIWAARRWVLREATGLPLVVATEEFLVTNRVLGHD